MPESNEQGQALLQTSPHTTGQPSTSANELGEFCWGMSREPEQSSMVAVTIFTILLGLIGCGLAILGVFGLFAGFAGSWHGVVAIVIGLAMVPAAIRMWSVQKTKLPQGQKGLIVRMYAKGIEYIEGESKTVMVWEDIQSATLTRREGFFAEINNEKDVVELVGKDGARIVLDDRLSAGDAFIHLQVDVSKRRVIGGS